MIDPIDLRKGNVVNTFVNTQYGKRYTEKTINCIHRNTIEVEENNTWEFSMVEGIPISHEKMIRLGFELYNESFYKIKHKKGFSEGWFLLKDGELIKSMSEFFVRIRFVHQLQNFWYSLTSKELNYKP